MTSKRILFGDDDPDIRGVIREILGSLGCEAVEANGGEEALDAYSRARHAETPFDLVILDLAMPYRNGFEVAEKIRNAGDDVTPILFMTASGEELQLHARAEQLSDVPILHKPFTCAEFLEAVNGALGRIEASQPV